MKIITKPPIGYSLVKRLFPDFDPEKHLMTLGDVIYTKYHLKHHIQDHILVHEMYHATQQRHSKFWGLIYFLKFAGSKKFRYNSELQAFKAQVDYLKTKLNEEQYLKLIDDEDLLIGFLLD